MAINHVTYNHRRFANLFRDKDFQTFVEETDMRITPDGKVCMRAGINITVITLQGQPENARQKIYKKLLESLEVVPYPGAMHEELPKGETKSFAKSNKQWEAKGQQIKSHAGRGINRKFNSFDKSRKRAGSIIGDMEKRDAVERGKSPH